MIERPFSFQYDQLSSVIFLTQLFFILMKDPV
jgi:hypothetical protein